MLLRHLTNNELLRQLEHLKGKSPLIDELMQRIPPSISNQGRMTPAPAPTPTGHRCPDCEAHVPCPQMNL